MDQIFHQSTTPILTFPRDLSVAEAGKKGRGVFAGKRFRKGEIIECSCIIELGREEHHRLAGSVLERYVFLFDKRKKSLALALGVGSLFNHSNEPNCSYSRNVNQKTITFRALKDISPNEEITIHYGPAGESFT